jgi:hypothetical protein
MLRIVTTKHLHQLENARQLAVEQRDEVRRYADRARLDWRREREHRIAEHHDREQLAQQLRTVRDQRDRAWSWLRRVREQLADVPAEP